MMQTDYAGDNININNINIIPNARTCARAGEGLSFRIDCVPPTATAQRKGVFVRGGRVRFFTKRPVREAEGFLAALLSMHAPDVPYSGPVALEARWTFPFRKSERRSVVKAGVDVPHVSRPDLDNLEKGLLDVMTRLGFWTDDSLVADKHTSKSRGARPGIEIAVRPLTGG